jgi:hypothetical protein
MKTAIELITEERQRQISALHYTAHHDDRHDHRELAKSALCYLQHYIRRAWTFTNELGMPGIEDGPATYRGEPAPNDWEWDEIYWKPKDPLSDLVKTAALIAAEIDRLQRLQPTA